MLQVKNGDIGRTAVLFDRYHASIYNYFMKIHRNKMISQDLTQNVFEKVIKYRSSYTDHKNFRSWVFTIAKDANIDEHRKKRPTDRCDDYVTIHSLEDNAQEVMEKSEKSKQLMKALDMLPVEEKELIVLTKFEKMKFAQVAEIMGMTENAVKVKSHRTIKKLRAILVNEIRYEY